MPFLVITTLYELVWHLCISLMLKSTNVNISMLRDTCIHLCSRYVTNVCHIFLAVTEDMSKSVARIVFMSRFHCAIDCCVRHVIKQCRPFQHVQSVIFIWGSRLPIESQVNFKITCIAYEVVYATEPAYLPFTLCWTTQLVRPFISHCTLLCTVFLYLLHQQFPLLTCTYKVAL